MPMISPLSRLSPLGHRGGINWSSYWAARNAYFALPATGVSLMVGQEVTIYGDSLINLPIGAATDNLAVTYTCDIGTQVGNNLVITPVAGDVGFHTLSVIFKNDSYVIDTQSISIRVHAVAAFSEKKILMIGDSTIDGDINTIAPAINTALGSGTLTYIGTLGATYKHEGIAGWTYKAFATNALSPFVNGGVIDLANYFTTNSIDTPDVVYFRLGVNEMITESLGSLTDLEIEDILGYADDLIDAFLAYNGLLQIIIALPTICENSGDGWAANYDETTRLQNSYIEYIHRLWEKIIERYDDYVYDTRVTVSCEAINLDRDLGYPKTDGVHTNAVHLSTLGSQQIGIGLAQYINAIYDNVFKITVDTTKVGSASDTFVLPINTALTYDYWIDWGEGEAEEHIEVASDQTHIYDESGTYQIKIRGTFPHIKFNNAGDKAKLMSIDNWGNIKWKMCDRSFYGCAAMTANYIDKPQTKWNTNLNRTFYSCSLFNGELDINTSNVNTMGGMLANTAAFNRSLASFDTKSVELMTSMLYNCSAFKQSLANFELDAITDMASMLYGCDINEEGTTDNYDETLVAWAADDNTPTGITFHGGNSKYSDVGEAARNILTAEIGSGGKGWTITADGGHI